MSTIRGEFSHLLEGGRYTNLIVTVGKHFRVMYNFALVDRHDFVSNSRDFTDISCIVDLSKKTDNGRHYVMCINTSRNNPLDSIMGTVVAGNTHATHKKLSNPNIHKHLMTEVLLFCNLLKESILIADEDNEDEISMRLETSIKSLSAKITSAYLAAMTN